MTEQEFVKECIRVIYRQNGYYDITILTQRDHEHLSHEIESKTSTLISVSTLKRLLHGEFSRIPQTATLNALSNYMGYKSWQEYKASVKVTQQSRQPIVNLGSPIKKTTRWFSPNRLKLFSVISLLIGVAVVILFVKFSSVTGRKNFDKATFSARKSTTNDIPNSVVFSYNVDDVIADSFFIQQSWDKNRRVRIIKNNYTLTDIYYEPGYHIAKLIANDSIIKTIDISIPTDRWFLYAKALSPQSIPQYVKPATPIIKNGFLGLDNNDLEMNQIDPLKEQNYVYTFFPSNMEVNSDNFVLKVRVRMNEIRNNLCPSLMVEVLTRRYFTYFQSTSTGCSSEAIAQFGENFINGKQADLSSLCSDLTNWHDIEMRVQNRNVKIFFGGKKVFTSSYKNPSGLITGIAFISNGLPELDSIELSGLDGTMVYSNDFSQPQ